MPAPVVHFEIGCKDIAKTREFYSKLLGWEYAPSPDAPPGAPSMAMIANLGPFAQNKTDGIGGHIAAMGHPPHQYVTFYAQVDDIEATLAHVQTLGGSTLIPNKKYQAWDGSRGSKTPKATSWDSGHP